MPTLNWIGKEAVVKHHKDVPYRLLEPVPELSCGDADSGNLIVQGDNLHALTALLPRYAGQVKCIYIDPPYNTGNENWVNNDNVNSPEIRKWLGQVVGKEGETLDRHDRWLCMMYPRLSLLRQFLREDGAIFISIDDYEHERLKLLMGDIFGTTAHVATFIWKRRTTPDSRNLNGISGDHEYVLCYQRNGGFRVRGQAKDLSKYKNPDNDPRGSWMSDNLTGLANAVERPNLHYDLVHPFVLVRALVDKKRTAYCERRTLPQVADKLRISHAARGNSVTIFETPAPWRPEFTKWTSMPVAKLPYAKECSMWSLHCADRNTVGTNVRSYVLIKA